VRDGWRWAALLVLLFVALAILRPVDHDESQYVAATVLSGHGLLPYRDYAYLQTPLQPLLFAPMAWVAGAWTWPVLRLLNALLGVVTVIATVGAARRAGAGPQMALVAGGLFAACDILLFSVGTARNDALPAACLAVALWLIAGEQTARRAVLIGLLLSAAAAAKISYALPAAAYGLVTLVDRRRWPGFVALGAVPATALVAALAAVSPEGFWFGAVHFPAAAPADWYAARPWKLSMAAKAVDTLKFLALGPALLALVAVIRGRAWAGVVGWLLAAGLLAAVLPTPTWRQYLLPALPALFVLLACAWTRTPPTKAWRIAATVFSVAGLAPSVAALAEGEAMPTAFAEGAAIHAAMDRARVAGPVATLSPQFLSFTGRLPDPRFAAGPFFFRGRAIVPEGDEQGLHVLSRGRLDRAFAAEPPQAILTGAEAWTSGDARLDAVLDRWAAANGYRAVAAGRFRLWIRSR
jgi:hypothetical protein